MHIYRFDDKLPLFQFNSYEPSLLIFFCISEQALIRGSFYILINKKKE